MQLRALMPAWQQHLTSDDYTEYCWHCPTVRLLVARPSLAGPPGFVYPAWVAECAWRHPRDHRSDDPGRRERPLERLSSTV